MYDSNKADKVIRFIEKVCTHVKGDLANKPFILEEWQIEYIKDDSTKQTATRLKRNVWPTLWYGERRWDTAVPHLVCVH